MLNKVGDVVVWFFKFLEDGFIVKIICKLFMIYGKKDGLKCWFIGNDFGSNVK